MLKAQAQAAFDLQWSQALADPENHKMKQEPVDPAFLAYLRTGKNPPPGYADMTEAERLALYKQTQQYQNYQASLVNWENENKHYQAWLHSGENPPAGMEDVTEAERLEMYQQTQENKDRQIPPPPPEPDVKKSTSPLLTKTPQTPWWQTAWDNIKRETITVAYDFVTWADKATNKMYDYHGPISQPTSVVGQVWLSVPGLPSSSQKDYILNNYQVDQMYQTWPSANECVTAAMLQDMNIIQDILFTSQGVDPTPHMDLTVFASVWNNESPLVWLLRPPEKTPIFGGMILPQNTIRVFEAHSQYLQDKYGCGYTVELSSGNTVDDLIENLQNGYPTSIHVAQPTSFFNHGYFLPTLLGGLPHTVTVVGYDATTDYWLILDPAKSNGLTMWHTDVLIDYWGRRFLFYPPRFSMTTLIPDTVCTSLTSPVSTPTLAPVSTPGQQSPTETPTATP